MGLNKDAKSGAVAAPWPVKALTERRPEEESLDMLHALDDWVSEECDGRTAEHPSLQSVLNCLMSKGITPFITDYSGCRQPDASYNGPTHAETFGRERIGNTDAENILTQPNRNSRNPDAIQECE